jgi:hypothetical protein
MASTALSARATKRGQLPDWGVAVGSAPRLWRKACRAAADGPRVLIATAVGGHPQMTVLESALAAALTLRGANVDILLCDHELPGCLRAKIAGIDPERMGRGKLKDVFCDSCIRTGREVFSGLGLDLLTFADTAGDEDRQLARDIAAQTPLARVDGLTVDDLPVGEHAMAGALRYFGRGDLSGESQGEAVVHRYVEAAILTARSVRRMLEERSYDVVVMNHGIYVPHGVIAALCRQMGVRAVAWNLGYRRQTAIFSHGDTYHHTLMAEPVEEWEGIPWSEASEGAIVAYLKTRQQGGARDWIWFNDNPDNDMDRFARESGLDWNKPVVGMLTNVVWDAQLHYPSNAFQNMIDWVVRTVEYFAGRPNLQLLIRVHPGELAPPGGSTESRQPVVGEIEKAFPTLPGNIFIIASDSPVSTYAAMKRCDTVLIYGTKTGVELTAMGIPVLVAGEAWIRNKGLTSDASSAEEYFALLDNLPNGSRLDESIVQRARKYAYHFFFRRMMPLPFLTPVPKGWPPYTVALRKLSDLGEGRFAGLDAVCDGILKGTPFVYRAEDHGVHDHDEAESRGV